MIRRPMRDAVAGARTDDAPIVVVGAGAAGLMAAIFAAAAPGAQDSRGARGSQGARVLLLERMREGGRKILISGGGRCNVLPSVLQPARFVTDSSPHTLRNLLRSWPLGEQRAFFESTLGVPLALEAESGKLFPASNRARDVRDALLREARTRGVEVRVEARVLDITPADAYAAAEAEAEAQAKASAGAGAGLGAARLWTVTVEGAAPIAAAAVILATGGLSVPATGSDGGGLAIARRLGHTIHETYPALTPLVADPAVHAALAGVSLHARLRANSISSSGRGSGGSSSAGSSSNGGSGSSSAGSDGLRGGAVITEGGFLFTHHGYSGPAVLDISHVAVRARLAGRAQPITAQWSLDHDDAAWQALLRTGDGVDGSTLVATRVRQRLPNRLADWLVQDAGIPMDRTLAMLTRAERLALIERLCRYPLPWTGDEGYKKAEVTGGGVALDQVDPRTLESRRHPGLFLCGELLDAFGPIGGHNFAWAWATGRLAGLGAARYTTVTHGGPHSH